jgi:hypothetical protein
VIIAELSRGKQSAHLAVDMAPGIVRRAETDALFPGDHRPINLVAVRETLVPLEIAQVGFLDDFRLIRRSYDRTMRHFP